MLLTALQSGQLKMLLVEPDELSQMACTTKLKQIDRYIYRQVRHDLRPQRILVNSDK